MGKNHPLCLAGPPPYWTLASPGPLSVVHHGFSLAIFAPLQHSRNTLVCLQPTSTCSLPATPFHLSSLSIYLVFNPHLCVLSPLPPMLFSDPRRSFCWFAQASLLRSSRSKWLMKIQNFQRIFSTSIDQKPAATDQRQRSSQSISQSMPRCFIVIPTCVSPPHAQCR